MGIIGGMTRSPCLSILLATACLWLVAPPLAMAEEAADPIDAAFHLDDASLPDPVRTPGGTSADVTSEDLCTTPADEFASVPAAALCDEAFAERRIGPEYRFQYRCGFLVSPAIGGSDVRKNVWLQPANEATLKQAVDKEARKRVCEHGIALTEAQNLIARDWVGLYRKFFRPSDKLLPITKAEGAPSAFDGPPPAPPAASACLGNGGANGLSADSGPRAVSPYAGDLGGGGAPDDRRRRRQGDRDRNGRPVPGSRSFASAAAADRSRPLRDGGGGALPVGQNVRLGALGARPDAAIPPRDRPLRQGGFEGERPRRVDGPGKPTMPNVRSTQSIAPTASPQVGMRNLPQNAAPRRLGQSGMQRRYR